MKSDLYFEIKGDDTPITFIHGFTLDHTMWNPQVEYFKKDFRTVTYDMRGFGKSPIPHAPYSHHEDLNILLEKLAIRKTHLVGLSLGGEVAVDFALTYPEKLLSLTLVDSSVGGYKSTVDWNVHGKEVGIEGAKKNWLNHDVFATTRKNTFASKITQQIVDNYSGWHFIHPDPRRKLAPAAIDRLNEIKTPTLILVGEKDLSYFHSIAKVLNEYIVHSQLKIIKGAGHMVNLEKTKEFNMILERFVKNSI